MKFRIFFIGVLALCIDLSRNSTLTRDEFIARRNRILAQRRARNNVQSDALSPSGQLSDNVRSRQVQNSTNFNPVNISPNLFNRRLSNPNQRTVNTRISTNLVTNRGSQRSGQRPRERQRTRTPRINLNGRRRLSDNSLRSQTRVLNSRIQSRQRALGRLNRGNFRRQGGIPGNSDIRGTDSNSLDARIGNQEPSQTGDNVVGSGFDSSISRVILTPVQDGAVRSLRTLLNSGRGNATPRLIGFLIPRPDGRTQLRLMRGAQRFFSSRRRRSQESSDDGPNETSPGPLPINLRTILEAARRANLLPTRNGSRGDRNRTPPIVVLRSPNRSEASISDDIASSPNRLGRRRELLRRTGSVSDRPGGTTNIDQRRVNIEVNVNNQGDDGAASAQPRRQRQRGVFRRRRPQLPRNTFDSVTQSPLLGDINSNSGSLLPSSSRRNTGIGLGMGLPTPPRRDFQNTFSQVDKSFNIMPSIDSVPIGETGRNPPNPFGGRSEQRARVGVAATRRRQSSGVEIPTFAGSFSNNVDSDVGRSNVNTIDNFRTDNVPGQTNNLLPTFSTSVDSFNLQRSTNPVDSQISQRNRASSRTRRPQTRVFQPQAVINDRNTARDFNTLPPRSDQPMVPVDSFNQIQRQPQIMNSPSISMVVPTNAPSLDVNFGRNESPVSSQQINTLRPQAIVQETRASESVRQSNPSFVRPVLLPDFSNPSTQNFPQRSTTGQDNMIRPDTSVNDPIRVPPFVQPVTDQTGAPTILNSQTSSVVEVPNLPGMMSTVNSFQNQPEIISGQISLDATPLNFTFDTNSITPVNLTHHIPLTNVSITPETNLLPVDALFASNTASLPKISVMDTSFNNVSLDARTQNAMIRQQIEEVLSGVPISDSAQGSVNTVNNLQGISVDQQINSISKSNNVDSGNNLIPPQINDPAPIIIETTPKVQIVTDAAITPTAVATVKVPALQTPDQLALVPVKPKPSTSDMKINISSTALKTQTTADLIPTGPPPPVIPPAGMDSSQVPVPSFREQNNLLNTNVQPFDVPKLIQTGAQNVPPQILPTDTRQMFFDAQIQNLPSPNNLVPQLGMRAMGILPSNSQNMRIPPQIVEQQSLSIENGQQPVVGFPVKFGNQMNALNTITKVMMDNLRNNNNQRQGPSEAIQSNRPQSIPAINLGALRNLINDVLKTFFLNSNMDLRAMSNQGPGSAIDLVEKVVVDAATAHIGAKGAQKAIVEQNIKATVKNTLKELTSIRSVPTQGMPSPIPTSGPDTISIIPSRSRNQQESINQNVTPPNFQWSNVNNPDPIVSSSSLNASASDKKVSKKGVSVFSTVPVKDSRKINMSLTVQIPDIPVQSVPNSTVQIIDKSPGIVIDAVPVTPAAPLTTTTATVPSTANLETISTTSLTTPSTVSITSTLPPSTSTFTSTSQSTFVTEITAVTTDAFVTSSSSLSSSSLSSSSPPSIAPIVVVSDSLAKEAIPPKPIPLFNTTSSKQSSSDDSNTLATKSTNTSSTSVELTLKNTTSNIEIPAPPPALRNPWLSRFPRHLNISLAYRMPKSNGNVRISHNVVNQAVVVKSLPSGVSGTSLVPDVTIENLPLASSRETGQGKGHQVTIAQNLRPPYAIPNLKAHAQKFGLVGHGGDLVRSADVGKPGGLPVFLPGSA